MSERVVWVALRAKVDGYTSKLGMAAKSTDAFAKKAKEAQRQADGWNKVGLAGAALGAGAAVLVKKSIGAASDLSETVAKAGVVFGQAAGRVESFGASAASSLGMSKQAAIDAAATFGVFGKSAGLSGDELAGFSTELVTLAADMASFSNTTPEQAIEALGAALRGESEPIRQYGVMLDDAALKAQALAQGIYSGTGPLTAQQKVLAARAAILQQTSDAQGDAARTADGLANTQRRLTAELQDAMAGIGEGLVGPAASAAGTLESLVAGFNGLPGPVKSSTLVIAGVGAAAMMAAPKLAAMKVAAAELGISFGRLGSKKAAAVAGGVITGLVAALGAYVAASGNASSAADALAGSFDSAGKSTADSLGQITAELAKDVSLEDWRRIPVTMAEVAQAALDGGPALDAMYERLNALRDQFRGEDDLQAVQAINGVISSLGNQVEVVDAANVAWQAKKAATDAASSAEDRAAASAARLGTMEEKAADAARAATAAHKGLADALAGLASRDAALSALNALKQSLKENGKAFAGASEAAIANRATLAEAATTADAHAQSMTNNAKKAEYLTGRIDAIRDALEDAGAKGPEIERILGPLERVRDKAQRAADAMDDLAGTYTVTTLYRQQGRTPAGPTGGQAVAAGGGHVRGPGTSTSDSIPAMLSDGEYVIRAAAVDRYGVGFLHDVNAMRLASGGLTDRQKARRQARRESRQSIADIRFEQTLAGLSDVDAALATLKREQGRLDRLKKGSVAWYQQRTTVRQAQADVSAARRGAAATAAQAAADAAERLAKAAGTWTDPDPIARQAQAIADARAEVEQLTQAWAQQVAQVQAALAAQSALSFDFARQAQAAEDATDAEAELLEARRAVNMASGRDRPDAVKRLQEAEQRYAAARKAQAAAAPTYDNVIAGFHEKAQALSQFRSNIEKLAKLGIHPSILQQLISQGMNGGAEMAAALVKFTPEQLGQINATQAQIETDANAIGQVSGNTMYGAQIMEAGGALIQISGSQPIQLNLDSRQVYSGLLELARQSGGTLSWTVA